PNVGLILDSFQTLSRKIDVNSIRSIPKEKIFIVQFRGGLSRAIAADGHRSLIYLGDQVRRHLGIGSMTGAAMPERPSVKG
ncbi:3-keto-5-aminohexanoate cleavage protein, partial [Rhizobium ruizarguesonis]